MVCYPEISIDAMMIGNNVFWTFLFLTLPKIILKVTDCMDTFQISLFVFNGTKAPIYNKI